jgi:fumarate reductase subunit D
MAKRPIEPWLWLLFSAGGVTAALLIPILLLLFGLVFPLDWISPPGHAELLGILRHPLTILVLFGFCVLSLFHAVHRLRYTLHDGLQIQHLNEFVSLLCYGGALVGSAAAAYLLWNVP